MREDSCLIKQNEGGKQKNPHSFSKIDASFSVSPSCQISCESPRMGSVRGTSLPFGAHAPLGAVHGFMDVGKLLFFPPFVLHHYT